MSKKLNMSMIQGDTLSFGLKIFTDQLPDSVFFSCSLNNNGDYIFQKELDDGITFREQTDKYVLYVVHVPPKDTKNIDPIDYLYDLQISINEDIYTILYGTLTIIPEITVEE